MTNNIQSVLKKHWGYKSFRHPQEEIINAVLEGQDVFAMLPTGGGKSLCYQVPALIFEGVTFVVSPLIALIEDQVQHLKKRGIPVGYVHSGMDKAQMAQAIDLLLDGHFRLFYLSPERLQNATFLEQIEDLDIDFLAIDEAHCISQWGHDFRPSYRLINDFKKLHPNIITLALTASATQLVKNDIIAQLELQEPKIYELSVVRPNLTYNVVYEEAKIPALVDLFAQRPSTSIVYCGTRRRTVEAANELSQHLGTTVYYYHAGMPKKEKDFAFQQWQQQTNAIISATSAFGMGIDKADVRSVAHVDLPTSIEQYYQEVGRAGRDGLPAKGFLYYNQGDINRLLRLPETQYPPIEFIKSVYQNLMDYLNIGMGEGLEWVRAFEILDFTKKFNVPMLKSISALRILEQEGFLIWQEDAKTQYTVCLTTTRTHLEYLEKNYASLYAVIEVLLRNYGGVFHFDTVIQIFELSKLLKIDKTVFEDRLYRLQDMGILKYSPAIVGSFMVLLENRLALPYLSINEYRLRERKAEFIAKIQSFISYIEDEQHCRNILLSRYFGQQVQLNDCGLCDNCKRKYEQIDAVEEAILNLILQHNKIAITEVLEAKPQFSKSIIFKSIRNLIDQQRIKLKDDCIYI